MGAISDRVAQMRGCSLAQIVAEIARMEAERDFGPLGVGVANQFELFWAMYPAKIAKKTALAAFKKAVQRTDFDVIMSGLEAYVNKRDDRPWCHASTWLNQERWNDQPSLPINKPSNTSELRNDLRHRISSQGSPDTGSVRRLPERQALR